jgi:hypothetical protein
MKYLAYPVVSTMTRYKDVPSTIISSKSRLSNDVLFAHFINVNKASENGASILLQFDSLDEVLLFLFNHYTGYSYELTPILFPTRFTSNSPHSNERKRKSETVNPICRNEVTTTNNITINSYLNWNVLHNL